jgi:hypothetical protein
MDGFWDVGTGSGDQSSRTAGTCGFIPEVMVEGLIHYL